VREHRDGIFAEICSCLGAAGCCRSFGRCTAAQDNLIDASGAGDLSQVKGLLAAKADVNAKAVDGRTALMLASQNGHLEVVQALLAAKADVNAKTVKGGTALMIAAQTGHLDVVRALVAAKADVNAGEPCSPRRPR